MAMVATDSMIKTSPTLAAMTAASYAVLCHTASSCVGWCGQTQSTQGKAEADSRVVKGSLVLLE